MNLLVTNTRNAQAYGIIRSLRPHARKIVATMYGANRFVARLSHAANSRYVDKRYIVPSPVEDWREGNIQRQNTEREEQYIQAILKICEQESIDVIFPSWEPKVYIFAKNKQRFEERNIILPILEYEVLIGAMDKYRLMKTAEQVGFPCPKTFTVQNENQLASIERYLRYPAIVKPRMSSGSRGLYLVRNRNELLEKISFAGRSLDWSLIQEYVPGSPSRRFVNIWLVLDENHNLLGSAAQTKLRTIFRDESSMGSAWESFRDDGLFDAATRLCRALKLTGVVNLQTKLDPRDNLHKLLEINPRIGYNFWIPRGLGLDTPLLALKLAKGEQCAAIRHRGTTVFLAPIPDAAALAVSLIGLCAVKVLGWRSVDPDDASPSLSELLKSYSATYRAPEKVFDPFFTDFFRDPLVSLTWWAAFGAFNMRGKLNTMRSMRKKTKPDVNVKPA